MSNQLLPIREKRAKLQKGQEVMKTSHVATVFLQSSMPVVSQGSSI